MGNVDTLLGYFDKEAKNIKARPELMFDKRDTNKRFLNQGDIDKGVNKFEIKENEEDIDNLLFNVRENRYIIVELIEKLDVKDADKEDRCFIHIKNSNDSFVTIPYLKYRSVTLDSEIDTEDYMADIIYKLFGVISKEAARDCASRVCEYLADVSINIYNYTKEFSEIGWDKYAGKTIFKYDKVYEVDRSIVEDMNPVYRKIADENQKTKKEIEEELKRTKSEKGLDDRAITELRKKRRKELLISVVDKYNVWSSNCKHEEASAFRKSEIPEDWKYKFKVASAVKETKLSDEEGIDTENLKKIEKDINRIYNNEYFVSSLKQLLANVMEASVNNRIVISAAFTGVFRQWLFDKDNNININVCGNPGTGKTTITRYALSLFGDPSELEGSFSDGEEAIEVLRAKRVFLPYVVDDRALRNLDKSDNAQYKDLLLSIFREYDSRVKERAGGKNAKYAGMRIYGPMLNSSVVSIFDTFKDKKAEDLGQYRRLIELKYTREGNYNLKGVPKKDLLDDIKFATNKCYGHIFPAFIQYLMNLDGELNNNRYIENNKNAVSIGEDIFRKYEDNRELVGKLIEFAEEADDNNNKYSSSTDRFALLLTSCDYLYGFLEVEDEKYSIQKRDMAIELVDNLRAKIANRDKKLEESEETKEIIISVSDYYDKIMLFFTRFNHLFREKGDTQIPVEEYKEGLGWYQYIGDKTLQLIFRPNMSIEFIMIYAEELLGRELTEEEVKE